VRYPVPSCTETKHSGGSERIDEIYPDSIRERLIKDDLSRPIVDHYDEATVLFADISSFRAWSSGRDPAEVFALLERLYGVFDSHLGDSINKIETIDDS
jgi:class 3 adenylate cyclase